jgi:hypothetical protein
MADDIQHAWAPAGGGDKRGICTPSLDFGGKKKKLKKEGNILNINIKI